MKWRVGDYRARKYEGKHGMGKVEKKGESTFPLFKLNKSFCIMCNLQETFDSG